MIAQSKRQTFQKLLIERSAEDIKALVDGLRSSDDQYSVAKKEEARDALCGSLAFVAYACPGATISTYDHIAAAWLSLPSKQEEPGKKYETCEIPEDFWSEFWSLVEGPEEGYDATSITLKSAGLSSFVSRDYLDIAERVGGQHPKADSPTVKVVPNLIDLNALQKLPEGSLGRDLHSMWTENNFDPEVLDRDMIGLGGLPPALRYLNTRILQMHDVWHLVGGYETTALHEIAISAFQLAQFGHNYSSMFLAGITKIMNEGGPESFDLVMQTICEAWQHGRDTPSLMAIEWEDHWHKPTVDIRKDFSIEVFESVLPSDMFEQLSAA